MFLSHDLQRQSLRHSVTMTIPVKEWRVNNNNIIYIYKPKHRNFR